MEERKQREVEHQREVEKMQEQLTMMREWMRIMQERVSEGHKRRIMIV